MAQPVEILREFQDKLTGAPAVVSKDHSYIHAGKAFSIIGTATINDGVTLKFSFTTPNTATPGKKYLHWRPAGITTSAAGVGYRLYRASTGISGGSAVTPQNRNHVSTNVSQVSVMQGVTVTEGTLVQAMNYGTSGNPVAASGGGGGSDHELVLAPNTAYTISLINLGGANSVVTWDFFWYEEDGYQ